MKGRIENIFKKNPFEGIDKIEKEDVIKILREYVQYNPEKTDLPTDTFSVELFDPTDDPDITVPGGLLIITFDKDAIRQVEIVPPSREQE